MEKLVIEGGHRLEGTIQISGAKNAALPLMAACLLCEGEHVLSNIPQLRDISTFSRVLQELGVKVDSSVPGRLKIDSSSVKSIEAPYDLVKTMRASVLVLCPLTARLGQARVSLPGGCAIGARPVDQHIMGLKKLGAEVSLDHGYVSTSVRQLVGCDIFFDVSTVTGTENVIMATVLADGVSRLYNAAQEPEVAELCNALNSMGARISGIGSDELEIEGVKRLSPMRHRVMSDRIEAGTFAIAAAITGGDVLLKDAEIAHLEALTQKLTEADVSIEKEASGIRVSRNGDLKSVNVKTSPYPGFATDLQAQMMALMTVSDGSSAITENVFENRFMHVNELIRMGADITLSGNTALVKGVKGLGGAPVMATDLRASAALVLAGLVAKGETSVNRIYHIDRGYEKIEEKLNRVGAKIERRPD